MTLHEKWEQHEDGMYYCPCGEMITAATLLIVGKQFAYCEKCQDIGMVRNIGGNWVEQENIGEIIEDLLTSN